MIKVAPACRVQSIGVYYPPPWLLWTWAAESYWLTCSNSLNTASPLRFESWDLRSNSDNRQKVIKKDTPQLAWLPPALQEVWSVCVFVVIWTYLFLFLIKVNDSHLLSSYCCACHKGFQQNSWLIERVFMRCTRAGPNQPIIIIQRCLFSLCCQSLAQTGGFYAARPGDRRCSVASETEPGVKTRSAQSVSHLKVL